MAFYVYILKCSDGSYYTGHTDDLERRIGEHMAGSFKGYTASRIPVELMWAADFPTRAEALERELQLKNWSRAKKEALFETDLGVSRASRMSRQGFSTRLEARSTRTGDDEISRSVRAEGRAQSRPVVEKDRPVIVLVRPQLGENIGKAARAMLNFGLTELRLVAPRDGWPNPDAGPAASGADSVLAEAQLYETLADAVADCSHIYATTVRKRGVTLPVVTPEEAVQEIGGETGRAAILFGPERSGLETEDVAVARKILTVPINPEFGSLNLAQAVVLFAYEWSKTQALEKPTETDAHPPAPQSELDGMIDHLFEILDDRGYFFPPDRTPATRATLRTIMTQPRWNSLQVRTLRGVWSALDPRRPRRER